MRVPTLIGCACALLAGLEALAQAPDAREQALRACLEIERDRDRLECLEAELATEDDANARSSPDDGAPVQSTPGRSRAASNPPVSRAPRDAPRAERAERNEANARREDFSSSREDGERTVTIAEVRRNRLGQTRFVTDDGVVYLQTSTQRGRYPDTPFVAELEPGARNTYFLSSPIGGPRGRVDRID